MSKNKKLESEEPAQFEYKHKAYGMYPVKEGPSVRYVLVEIGYDPESGDVGFIKESPKDIKEDVIDRLKGKIGDLFITEVE